MYIPAPGVTAIIDLWLNPQFDLITSVFTNPPKRSSYIWICNSVSNSRNDFCGNRGVYIGFGSEAFKCKINVF